MAKTEAEITHELEAVKRHLRWPIKEISTIAMYGAKVLVTIRGDEPMFRELTITDTNERAVQKCLRQVFPEVMEADGALGYQVRKNGVYLTDRASFEEAKNYISSAISDYEQIYAIEDQAGRVTRFVANKDGSLLQLD